MEDLNIHEDYRCKRHESYVRQVLPNRDKYGYYAMYSIVIPAIKVPIERLNTTFLDLNIIYTEALTYAQAPIVHQDGYSRIYEVKTGTNNPGNTQVTTCYLDGLIVTDGYIDMFCEEKDGLNPNWFFYKIQRHLQLSGEIFQGITKQFIFVLSFNGLEKFKWELYRNGRIYRTIPYTGYYHDIIFNVDMSEIHDREKWNIKMDLAEKIMIEVAKIFGMDKLPQQYWSDNQELDYPHGIDGR